MSVLEPEEVKGGHQIPVSVTVRECEGECKCVEGRAGNQNQVFCKSHLSSISPYKVTSLQIVTAESWLLCMVKCDLKSAYETHSCQINQ